MSVLFPNLEFPPIEFPEEVQPVKVAREPTHLEKIEVAYPALHDMIVRNWGTQRLHDDMNKLLFGKAGAVRSDLLESVLAIFNHHAEKFNLQVTVEKPKAMDTWWHVETRL